MQRHRDIEWSSNRAAVRTGTLRLAEDSNVLENIRQRVGRFVARSKFLLLKCVSRESHNAKHGKTSSRCSAPPRSVNQAALLIERLIFDLGKRCENLTKHRSFEKHYGLPPRQRASPPE
jgi:hypothetical protein